MLFRTRPGFQPFRRRENVLHAVHQGRAIRHFRHQDQTFHAQQAVSGMIGQSLQQQS
jgi:hypothetical protein